MGQLQMHYRPEFLNRLDEKVLFKPLGEADLTNIITLLVVGLNERLADRRIRIQLTKEAEEAAVREAYDPRYGARQLKSYVQTHIETACARLILEDKVMPGDTITVDYEDGKFVSRVGQD